MKTATSLFSNYLPWAGMIDDGIIITKDGMLLRAFSFSPKDFSYLNESEIITSLNCLKNSFRFLGLNTEYYIYLLYSTAYKKSHRLFLFQTDSDTSISEDLNSFIQVTDDIYQILDSSGLLTYLHSFFSNHHEVLMPECPFYLDVYLSDATFKPDTICTLNIS